MSKFHTGPDNIQEKYAKELNELGIKESPVILKVRIPDSVLVL